MSDRLSKYNFRNSERFSSVPEEEALLHQEGTGNYDKEINKICEKCHNNEQSWREIKFLYRTVECFGILGSICLSIISVIFSAYFFPKYRIVFSYLEQQKLAPFSLFIQLPLVYLILEIVAVLFDFMRVLLTIKLLRMFATEKKDRYILENKHQDNPYLLKDASENSITLKLINNLKLRVDLKTQLKKMFNSMIRLEVFINFYYFFFMIGPKILTASFIQMNLIPEFTGNLTKALETDATYGKLFSCCESVEESCDVSLANSVCVQDNVKQYLQLMIIVFLTTACIKLVIQLWLIGNLKLNLMDKLVNKKYVEEINLKRLYEKCRSASFSVNVQALIEDNERRNHEQLELLNHRSANNPDENGSLHYSEIRI